MGMGDAPWYERWFGPEYLELYAHRDREEARRAVALVDERLPGPPPAGGRVLDLACGPGRHLAELAARGYAGIGLDLSAALLDHARRELGAIPLLRGDMRHIPLANGSVGLVTSFFTSFGYFDRPEDDGRVLDEVRRILAEDGWFVLDFLNAERVRRNLEPRDEEVVRGVRVVQERALVESGRRVEKRIEVGDPESPDHRSFRERVRLYDRSELERALRARGLEPAETFGDYHGSPFDSGSPRLIVMARAASGARSHEHPARRPF